MSEANLPIRFRRVLRAVVGRRNRSLPSISSSMLAGGSPIHDAVNCQLCPLLSAVVLRIKLGTFARRRQLSVLRLKSSSGSPFACRGQTYKPFSRRGASPPPSSTREKISVS